MTEEQSKKEAIFNATIRLVREKGFHSTPMSLIAKEAGVAAGTIYLYFKSKEDLLNQLYLKLKKEYGESLTQGSDAKAPLRDLFEVVWRNALRFQMERSSEFLYMEQFKNSPFIYQETIEESMKLFQFLKVLQEKAKVEKVIKDLPGSILLALFFAPLSDLVKQYLRSETTPSEEEIQVALQGCWDAIKR